MRTPKVHLTRSSLVLAGALTLLAHASCSSDPDPAESAPSVRFRMPAAGVPNPLDVPFPTDLYRMGPGGTGVVGEQLANWDNLGVSLMQEALHYAYAGLDGFGHTSGALFLVDGTAAGGHVDAATLPKVGTDCLRSDSPVAIVDVDDAGATDARLGCVASYVPDLKILVVHPEGSLRTGHRYAVVVTDRVRTTSGQPLVAPRAFRSIVDGAGDARSTAVGTLYGAALDRAISRLGDGFTASHIVGAAVYSASSEHRRLRPVRDALVAGDYGPPPQLLVGTDTAPFGYYRFGQTAAAGYTATLEEWLGTATKGTDGKDLAGGPGDSGNPGPQGVGNPHDAIGAVIQGAITAPEFRKAWASSPKPGDGTFELDASGKVIAQPTPNKIPISISLPKTPPPPGGYPVLIASHGTPSNRQFIMSFANEAARAGIAVVAMEGLYHGLRSREAADLKSNFAGTYKGPDGFNDSGDTPTTILDLGASLSSAPRYRANLWQYQIEWSQLRRLITNPALDLSVVADQYPAGTTLHFDASHVGWIGTSWGAVTGASMLALEPGIQAFMLNCGNGDMLQWQGESPANKQGIILGTLLFGFPGSVPLNRFNPLTNVIFGAMEPGYAASATEDVGAGGDAPGPDLLMTEVEFDQYISNRSTEILAKALGLPQLAPNARAVPTLTQMASPISGNANGRTRALVHMGTASHSANLARRWEVREYQFPDVLEDDLTWSFPMITPPIWVRQPVQATQAMMVKFFTTSFAGAAVIDATGIPLRIDFDDDGYCDATERTAGTSWFDPASHPASTQDCAWQQP